MKRTTIFWILAFLITIVSALFQRVTGPTYPLSGTVDFEGKKIAYKLERSHNSDKNYMVKICTKDPFTHGVLYFRKFGNVENFTAVDMIVGGKDTIIAEMPAQQRLQKLEYFIMIFKGDLTTTIPLNNKVVIRFKDSVPLWVLIPHIFAMFFAMMLSTRTGLEYFSKEPKLEKLSLWTIIILFIGGFPLGFLMNGLAFGEVWGGFPFGSDVTDNKTQIAFIFWLFAFYMIKKNKQPKLWALLAAILLIIAYSIPHSI